MIATLSLSVLSLTSLFAAASPTNLRLVDGAVMLCERSDVASEGPYDADPVYDCAAAQLPAVVDCADALTVALGEMIGECESPSRVGLVPPATIQASLLPLPSPSDDRPTGKRYCTADRCGMERSPPLQNAPRTHGLIPGLLPIAITLPALPVERATIPYVPHVADGQLRGLFRPPRA